MPVKIHSAAVFGINPIAVDIEVDATPGLRFFNIVGLASKVVEESKDRIAAAIRNCGLVPYTAKNRRVIVNLAPANIKKEGPLFDLPIALGYLLATNQIDFNPVGKICIGELSLDGSVKPVNGVLPIAIFAKNKGFSEIIVPHLNSEEASLVKGLKIIGVSNLREVIQHLTGENPMEPYKKTGKNKNVSRETSAKTGETTSNFVDFSTIRGQETAKFAITIAAAGGHNILMYGPPGSGKTLLAKAFASILPPALYEESLEITKIFSVSGLLTEFSSEMISRPFRSPHHTASPHSVIGGGTIPKPGEISLAHHGVLFLDELPEFPRSVIEALRQPLEDGEIIVSRTAGTVKFPAKFILVAAMNPCPCGNFGGEGAECICLPSSISKYQKKVSGPLLDRIDLHVNVPRETFSKISGKSTGETSKEIRKKIIEARKVQYRRFKSAKTNAHMGIKEIERYCALNDETNNFLKISVEKKGISARSYHKILKIARTMADLEGKNNIGTSHIAGALNFRFFDGIRGIS